MFLNSVVLHLASCFSDDQKDGGDSERSLGEGGGGGCPAKDLDASLTVNFPTNQCIFNIIMIFW